MAIAEQLVNKGRVDRAFLDPSEVVDRHRLAVHVDGDADQPVRVFPDVTHQIDLSDGDRPRPHTTVGLCQKRVRSGELGKAFARRPVLD